MKQTNRWLRILGLILAVNYLFAGFLSAQETTVDSQETSVIEKELATAEDEEVIVLDPFVLTETTSVGYGTTVTSAGSRFNASLMDLSQSVIPVNHELMDDVAAIDPDDALRYISGIGPASTVTIGTFMIRGFPVRGGSSSYLDGLPGAVVEHETEFVERYEVVKGAAGSLYGEHSLGGLINRVYKVPTKTRQTTLKFLYSSIGNTMQGSFDTSGPFDKAGQLSYRVIGVVRSGEVNTGAPDDKENLYWTLQFEPEDTGIRTWWRMKYSNVRSGHETAGVFYDGAGRPSTDLTGSGIAIVPVPNVEERKNYGYELGLSNRFSGLWGDWNFRVVGRYDLATNIDRTPDIIPLGFSFIRADGSVFGTTGTSVKPGQPLFSDFGKEYTDIRLSGSVSRISGPSYSDNYGVFVDLAGRFSTGVVNHNLLVYTQMTGVRSRGEFTNVVFKEEYGGSSFTDNLNLDNAYSIINPVTLPESRTYFDYPDGPSSKSESTGDWRYNAGIQDNISFLDDRFLVTLGARYDFVNKGSITNLVNDPPTSNRGKTTNNWVYKAGLVYKIIPERVAAFINYSTTFEPRYGELIRDSGIPFKNLEGVSKEIGVKLQLYESALLLTASYFNSDLLNNPVRIFNPDTGLDEFVQEGTTTSNGWEADLAWRVNNNFTFQLAATDQETLGWDSATQAKTRGQRNAQMGFRWSGVAKYTFTDGVFRGLTGGLAVVNLADRPGDSSSSFIAEGYTKGDLFFTYLTNDGKWRFQVNFNNVTDVKGTISSIISSLAHAEDGRHVKLSTTFRF